MYLITDVLNSIGIAFVLWFSFTFWYIWAFFKRKWPFEEKRDPVLECAIFGIGIFVAPFLSIMFAVIYKILMLLLVFGLVIFGLYKLRENRNTKKGINNE